MFTRVTYKTRKTGLSMSANYLAANPFAEWGVLCWG
jgi:hypothetical protein